MFAWDVADLEDPTIAADLVSRAFIRELICKGHKQPLISHADTGSAIRAATLESWLVELAVLGSFSRPWVSIENSYSESLFRLYRPSARMDPHYCLCELARADPLAA